MQYRGNRSCGTSTSGYFPPAVKWLIIVNCAIFAIEWFGAFLLDVTLPIRGLYLYPVDVLHGKIWQLVTYMFFHGDPVHLLCNMLMLWMFGWMLENDWGTKRFLQFYFLCGIGAGISVVLVTSVLRPGQAAYPTLGASGAIFGLLLAFGVIYADSVILMMFLFPMKAKYAVMIFGAVEFVLSWRGGSRVSHIAHLGGMLFGYVYLKSALLRRPVRGTPRVSLRQRFNDWKTLRARRRFQVYMKKQQRDRDRWVN